MKPQMLSLHSYLHTAGSNPLELVTYRKQCLTLQKVEYNKKVKEQLKK